jgi:SAM-dependent methyltransferase
MGRLGDTAQRDYTRKLQLFDQFAAPELQQIAGQLALQPGMRVLDAGCGTGEMLERLRAAIQPGGLAVGIDLAHAHVQAAAARCAEGGAVAQADLTRLPLATGTFDLIWCANALHHLADPASGFRALLQLLRPPGRLVLAQSGLLPEMCFAWDTRLERAVNDAVQAYYQQRYTIPAPALNSVRALVGLARQAPLRQLAVHTVLIERVAPLARADRSYLGEAIFRDTWGQRLQPFLAPEDYASLQTLCDPAHRNFALDRPDFHYLQSLTIVACAV